MKMTIKEQLAAALARVNHVEAQLADAVADRDFLRGRQEACAKEHRCSMDEERRQLEKVRKEKEAVVAENVTLRENLQRALGYIDKVNESLPPPEQVMTCPPQYMSVQRGPQLQSLPVQSNDQDSMRRYR